MRLITQRHHQNARKLKHGKTPIKVMRIKLNAISFNQLTLHTKPMKNCHYTLDGNDDLPCIDGGQSSPTNPHSGISRGGSVKIPEVSRECIVII